VTTEKIFVNLQTYLIDIYFFVNNIIEIKHNFLYRVQKIVHPGSRIAKWYHQWTLHSTLSTLAYYAFPLGYLFVSPQAVKLKNINKQILHKIKTGI